MTDLGGSSGGSVTLPLLNASVKKMAVYATSVAPKKTSFTASNLASSPVIVNLTSFNPGEIDSTEAVASSNLEIGMYKSDASCSVPYPNASCSLLDLTQFDAFSPLTVVMGGGKIDFMMRMKSNNITVKYINVDMLASGPPDALFDSSANQSSSGADLDAVWRFGSMGPEIYDRVLIGIPYDSGVDTTAPISIVLNHLYDQNWNPIWNSTGSPNAENYSTVSNGDYSTFNSSWFNTSLGGVSCSLTNPLADCHINVTNRMIWLRIPHFSGTGLLANSFSAGNVSINTTLTQIPCTYNCTVYINVTNSNYTLATTLHNITMNSSVSISNVINFSIFTYNQTNWLLNGTNNTVHWDYNFTLYNGSAVTVHQYRVNITKRDSNSTLWNLTYNISGFTTLLVLQLNLTCVENWSYSAWSTCIDNQQIRTATDASSCGTTDNRLALLQSCTPASTSSSSGGGGAGGAAAGVPTSVVGQFEQKTWTSINSGETAIIPISNGEIGITQVSFGVDKTVWGPWIKVEKKDSLPTSIGKFSNKAYKYIDVTKSPVLKDDLIKSGKIDFKVKKTWLSDNKLTKEQVAMFRYVENKWTELKTTVGNDDGTYVHYTAETPGFSYFVIGQKTTVAPVAEEKPKEEAKPTVTVPAPIAEAEEAVVTTPEAEGTSNLVWLGLVLGVLVAAIIIWVLTHRKKKF
ncbi:PGF-pre-PGF domain-containing protein [Candidatus Woesearchaeota archaeon]|nr:PGF-pre-PGF domain-containing protein [Candidatus Woesearchaeota archaeon]